MQTQEEMERERLATGGHPREKWPDGSRGLEVSDPDDVWAENQSRHDEKTARYQEALEAQRELEDEANARKKFAREEAQRIRVQKRRAKEKKAKKSRRKNR